MRVFLDGVANVESPFGFDVSRLRTLSEGNAVHHIVAFIVHQFQFDVFLSASHHLACAVVVDFFRTEHRLRVRRSEWCKPAQLLVVAEGHVLKVDERINVECSLRFVRPEYVP